MKKILLLFAFVACFVGSALAQERTVSGKVTDSETGEALPGVNILVKGTTQGTVTDTDGNFKVAVSNNATLVFSFIGFKVQEVAVGTQSTINVSLKDDADVLSEVVVVGYGTQTRTDLTGNIASMAGKDIQNLPVPSLESAIQGRAAGVFVESGSGKVGQGIRVRVRGTSSLSASSQPLYVVDGMIITSESQGRTGNDETNPLADLNFNDVESIEVLKDASASAIYGARAANGVVIITTKKGKAGKTNFSLNYSRGFSTPTKKQEWLNAKEYVELFTEASINGVGDASEAEGTFDFLNPDWKSNTVDENWEERAYQEASTAALDFSASGGNDKTRFFVSGSYLDQNGILIKNGFKRYSGRINLEHTASDRITLGANMSFARSFLTRVSDDNAFSTPMQMVAQSPLSPAYDKSGELNRFSVLYDNGLIDARDGRDETTIYRTLGNVYGVVSLIKGLTFRSEFGVDALMQTENGYFGNKTIAGGNNSGFGRNRQVTVLNYNTNNFLSYNTSSDKYNFDAILGMSYQETDTRVADVQGENFPNDNFKNIASASQITFGSTTGTISSFLSYFSRANIKISNKYLFGLTGRIDGSSRFGKSNRYGFFPSVSAGWIVSEESFMQNIKQISFLKLRASYGITGNAEIGNFDSRALYNGTAYAGLSGILASQLGNDDLKWETTSQLNVGFNLGILNDRVSFEFDYYDKNTEDLLLNFTIPHTTGFGVVTRNLGKLQNSGFELVVNTNNLVGDFKWNTSINLARNVNKVIDLQGQRIPGGGRGPNFALEGEPLGVFFMVKYAGVNPENGDALYYDLKGEKTSTYSLDNRQIVGNPIPDFIGGITNTFSYKGFDLNVMFQFVYGNEIYNAAGIYQAVSGDFFDNQLKSQLSRWKKPGDVTDVPQARLYGANGTQASSRWIYDGSYLRLKTLNFGYTVPKEWTNKIYLTNLRLYMTGQNLLTFTKYPGWDPEVNTDTQGNIAGGTDFYTAPQPRTLIFGLNIGF